MSSAWNKRILTDEQIDFLKTQLKMNICYNEILHNFNNKYPNDQFISRCSLATFMRRNNLSNRKYRNYKIVTSQEQLDFVIELVNNIEYTWVDITREFNKKFNKNISKNSLKDCMNVTHKIHRPKELTNSGKFDGYKNLIHKPVGTEVEKYDYIWIKVNDERVNDQAKRNEIYKHNWRPKQVYLWEKYHNEKVNENEIVIFLDGDKRNFDINNLRKITRSTHATLSKYQSHNYGEITNAMIEVIETNQVLKEVLKDDN